MAGARSPATTTLHSDAPAPAPLEAQPSHPAAPLLLTDLPGVSSSSRVPSAPTGQSSPARGTDPSTPHTLSSAQSGEGHASRPALSAAATALSARSSTSSRRSRTPGRQASESRMARRRERPAPAPADSSALALTSNGLADRSAQAPPLSQTSPLLPSSSHPPASPSLPHSPARPNRTEPSGDAPIPPPSPLLSVDSQPPAVASRAWSDEPPAQQPARAHSPPGIEHLQLLQRSLAAPRGPRSPPRGASASWATQAPQPPTLDAPTVRDHTHQPRAQLRVLLLFSGPREATSNLPRLLQDAGCDVVAIDTKLGGAAHDVLRPEVGNPILQQVQGAAFDAVFITMPCSSY